MDNETSSSASRHIDEKSLGLNKARVGIRSLEDVRTESDDIKDNQGSSFEGMFTTLLVISQETSQIVQELTKEVEFIKKLVLGKGIAYDDDDNN